MPKTATSQHLTQDQLIRRRGWSNEKKAVVGIPISIGCSSVTLVLAAIFNNEIDKVYIFLIFGAANGLIPTGMLFLLIALWRKFVPAASICFGFQAFATMGAVLYDPFSTVTGSIMLYAWGGFGVGSLIVLIWGPREVIYRYATCPGCKYDLSLLPKSDVCPECGRDNRDLVEAFADVYR